MKKLYVLVVLLGTSLYAQDSVAVTGKFGTLGFGLDATMKVDTMLNARVNINKGSLDLDASDSELTSDGSIDLFSAGALVDYHPMSNGFRLSGGVYYNGNSVDVTSSEVKNNVKVGSHYYDFTKDSKTHVEITTNDIAPYVGIGWGNAVDPQSPWHFSLDVGVLYQGKVTSKLTSSGTAKEHDSGKIINLSTNKQFLKDAKNERNFIDDNTKGIEWYPVISLGVSYAF